jgi:hypothetical protein
VPELELEFVGVPLAPQAVRRSISTATMEKDIISKRGLGLLSIISS